jgi:hypothetical protein
MQANAADVLMAHAVERSGLEDDGPTRAALAAHEAGHAAAGWALGRRVERVWIDTGGGTEIGNTTALSLTDQATGARRSTRMCGPCV